MVFHIPQISWMFLLSTLIIVEALKMPDFRAMKQTQQIHQASFIDDLSLFRAGEKKCLVGLTTVITH